MRGPHSVAGLASAVVSFGTAAVYVAVITAQGPPTDWVFTAAVAGLIGLLGAGTTVASFTLDPRQRLLQFAATGTLLLALGVVAIFSIGMLLLVAGGCAFLAASGAGISAGRAGDRPVAMIGALALALPGVAVLAVALAFVANV